MGIISQQYVSVIYVYAAVAVCVLYERHYIAGMYYYVMIQLYEKYYLAIRGRLNCAYKKDIVFILSTSLG